MSSPLYHQSLISKKWMLILRPLVVIGINILCILILLPLLYLIEPFWRIRITHFSADRIGHLAPEPQLWLARLLLKEKLSPRTTHILLAGNPCNRPLLEMWKRRLPICDNRLLSGLWHYCKHLLRKTRFDDPKLQRFDEYREFDFKGAHLTFTDDEERKGRDLLERMGIDKGDWFVAFNARDHAFVEQRFPDLDSAELDRGAHFRNVGVEEYLKAAELIAENGGFAIRMGAAVSYPLKTSNPRIIDYASNFRSEFGDVYLCGKSRFFLGGPSGLSFLPVAFGIPVVAVSQIPIFPLTLGIQSLYMPMLLRDRKSRRLYSFDQAYKKGLFSEKPGMIWNTLERFDSADIDLEHNSPEEIADICQDMIDRLEGIPPPDDATNLQRLFKKRFLSGIRNYELAPDIGPRFALKFRHLIDD